MSTMSEETTPAIPAIWEGVRRFVALPDCSDVYRAMDAIRQAGFGPEANRPVCIFREGEALLGEGLRALKQ